MRGLSFMQIERFGGSMRAAFETTLLVIAVLFVLALFIPLSAHAQSCTVGQATACFTASKLTGESPLATTLTWNVPGAATCTAAGGASAWNGPVACSGTKNLSGVTVPMTLTLAAVGPSTPGKSRLDWTHDGKNTDGSNAVLAGFTIVYGASSTALVSTVLVNDPAARTYTVDNLATGTWFFGVRARSTGGAESVNSNVAQKAVVATPGQALPMQTVQLTPIQTPTAPVLTVSDVNAMEIKPSSTGALTATRVGRIRLGTRCFTDERTVGTITYNGVPIELVDFVNWPTNDNLTETWAKCASATTAMNVE